MTHTVWQRSNVTPLYLSIVRKLTVILESDDASFDEPVRETIMRDLREVAHKFRHVIAPQKEVCRKQNYNEGSKNVMTHNL